MNNCLKKSGMMFWKGGRTHLDPIKVKRPTGEDDECGGCAQG